METQTITPRKIKNYLWYAANKPEFITERVQNCLDGITDPVLHQTYQAIKSDLMPWEIRDPNVVECLDDILINHRPAETYLKIQDGHYRTKANGRELVSQLFPGAAPSFFSGHFPNARHKTLCKTRWVATGEGGNVTGMTKIAFSNWRGFWTKNGRFFEPCPHCIHERVLKFCKQIMKGSKIYRHENLIRFTTCDDAKVAKRLQDRIRQRNRRYMGIVKGLKEARRKGTKTKIEELETKLAESKGYAFNTSFPLETGEVIILHDAHDIEGEKLPEEKDSLYDLVASWVLNTPKGKRAGHGLAKWGHIDTNTVVDNDENQAETAVNEENKQNQRVEEAAAKWRILGENYGKMAVAVGAYLGETPKYAKGLKFKIPLSEFFKILEAVGIDYVIEGDLPENVTDKRELQNNSSLIRDKLPIKQTNFCFAGIETSKNEVLE